MKAEACLEELSLLAATLGCRVAQTRVFKLAHFTPRYCIGTGQIELLKSLVEKHKAEAVLFDNELSPAQVTNLAEFLGVEIVSRTDVILRIFSLRAKTTIAKLQVELARLSFEYPRLKGKWSTLSHTDSVVGKMGGPGETQLEYGRRHARERMHVIKQELKRAEQSKATGRRSRAAAFRVSLAGYTNAGKSTLFNALCREQTYVENKLFATLDTFTRKLYLSGVSTDIVLSDTVGFIERLPHLLVESFKSTLAEIAEANIILHVADASRDDIDSVLATVESTLSEIGAGSVPTLLVFNKTDLITPLKRDGLAGRFPDALFVSALTRTGFDELKETLKRHILLPAADVTNEAAPPAE
ncbi:MAG: GTPase HflX [Spirochaetes bacterium]|nr:GTPase HflX [Spirochaetota bacterium]